MHRFGKHEHDCQAIHTLAWVQVLKEFDGEVLERDHQRDLLWPFPRENFNKGLETWMTIRGALERLATPRARSVPSGSTLELSDSSFERTLITSP